MIKQAIKLLINKAYLVEHKMGACVGGTKEIRGKQEKENEFGRVSQLETSPSKIVTNKENGNEKRIQKRLMQYENEREISSINHRSLQTQPFDNHLLIQNEQQGSTNSGSFNKKILSPLEINIKNIKIRHHEKLEQKLASASLKSSFDETSKQPQSLVQFTNDELDLRSTFIPSKLADNSEEIKTKKYVVGLSVISEQNSKLSISKASNKIKLQSESSIRSKQKFGPKLRNSYELAVDYPPSGIIFNY